MQFVNAHTHRPTGRHIEPFGAGIHPWDADKKSVEDISAELAKADIIGETGLDLARIASVPLQRQVEVFEQQLQTAAKLDKPVILHCVRAFEPMMRILARYPLRAVIFHGFTGSPQQARQALERGYFLSFGERTFKSPKAIEALKITPMHRLFLETDDADVEIERIYERTAEIKELSITELQSAILENYKLIFKQI